jgi:hypothetical protein
MRYPPRPGWRRRLRNAVVNLRRLLRRAPAPSAPPAPKPPGPPRADFSYTIFWTKQVRAWDAVRRAAVSAALGPVLAQPDFEANAYARRYAVPGLDDQAHSGLSLIALRKVLAAFMDTDSFTHES